MNKIPHKHAELACKWFMDQSIQIQIKDIFDGQWVDVPSPTWNNQVEHREKPKEVVAPEFKLPTPKFRLGDEVYTKTHLIRDLKATRGSVTITEISLIIDNGGVYIKYKTPGSVWLEKDLVLASTHKQWLKNYLQELQDNL